MISLFWFLWYISKQKTEKDPNFCFSFLKQKKKNVQFWLPYFQIRVGKLLLHNFDLIISKKKSASCQLVGMTCSICIRNTTHDLIRASKLSVKVWAMNIYMTQQIQCSAQSLLPNSPWFLTDSRFLPIQVELVVCFAGKCFLKHGNRLTSNH